MALKEFTHGEALRKWDESHPSKVFPHLHPDIGHGSLLRTLGSYKQDGVQAFLRIGWDGKGQIMALGSQ